MKSKSKLSFFMSTLIFLFFKSRQKPNESSWKNSVKLGKPPPPHHHRHQKKKTLEGSVKFIKKNSVKLKSKSKSSFLISTSILASARRVGVGGGVGGDDGWFIGACNRGTARIANDRRNEWIIGSLNRTWWPSVPANEDSGPIESIAFPMRLNWLYLVKPYWTTYMRSRPLNKKLKKIQTVNQ